MDKIIFIVFFAMLNFSCELEEIPDQFGVISALNCSGAVLNGNLFAQQITENTSLTVPYIGGDGGGYGMRVVYSSGVTGLSATIEPGNFSIGSGSITYKIEGVPKGSGDAVFLLSIGGKTCTISLPVQLANGTISTLNCADPDIDGVLYAQLPANSVSVGIEYTGGNGGLYSGDSIPSNGVLGLYAKLEVGYFSNGDGELRYQIYGIPQNPGTAEFDVSIAGRSCKFYVEVGLSTGTVGSIDCQSVISNGNMVDGVPSSGVSFTINYLGGNGGTHGGQMVESTGVEGLTATLAAGTFNSGNGSLNYVITGTPDTSGYAIFNLGIGGKFCQVSLSVSSGLVLGINCDDSYVNGGLTKSQLVNNIKMFIPYTGGNGGPYVKQIIYSMGVTGISAVLEAGKFEVGADTLVYQLTGTAWASGTAIFSINIGGRDCLVYIPVQETSGSISSLSCENPVVSNTLVVGQSTAGTTITVQYTGGNGGGYNTQLLNSLGITAQLMAGNFTNGSGSIQYNLNGIPNSSGVATFPLNVGGVSCNLNVVVLGSSGTPCSAKIAVNVTKEFMCHNLGSANMSADPFIPSWEINGAYYQWGRINPSASGPTASEANSGAVTGWSSGVSSNGAWLDNVKTANDPCPAGYKIPTFGQWQNILDYNTVTSIGTWEAGNLNYNSGTMIGNNLFLPAAGYRSDINGSLGYRNNYGFYWSSTENGNFEAYYLGFQNNSLITPSGLRAYGASIRCITE